MKQVHLMVHGRVQGVFFRYNTKRIARKLGIKGFVKNLKDGTVEVFAQGEDEKLQELISFCRKGPMFARVDKVDIVHENVEKEFMEFSIKS